MTRLKILVIHWRNTLKFTKGWWDELDSWFWEDVFQRRWGDDYIDFRFATPSEDYYKGVDAWVIIVSADKDRGIQMKASENNSDISLAKLKVNFAYQSQNGKPSGFGTYFRGNTNSPENHKNKGIHEFVFSYPFQGKTLFVKYEAMYDFWHGFLTNNHKKYVRYGRGMNEYYQVTLATFYNNLPKNGRKMYNTAIMDYDEVMKNYV